MYALARDQDVEIGMTNFIRRESISSDYISSLLASCSSNLNVGREAVTTAQNWIQNRTEGLITNTRLQYDSHL